MRMAEEQSAHRRQMEERKLDDESRLSKRGQWFGFVLGILGLSFAFILGLYQNTWAASILGGGTLVALVSVFVIGRRKSESSTKSKKRE